VFSLALGFAAVWHIWWLAIAAFVAIAATVIGRSFGRDDGYYIPADVVRSIENKGRTPLAQHAGVSPELAEVE
jgi:cytochrome o ubiquinol oxidase subunit I